MSKHDVLVRLRQIEEIAQKATELGNRGNLEKLQNDWEYRLAAERAIEPIGEAATRLPQDLRNRHPSIPWREIISMQNRLIHGYDGVDYEIVWDVLVNYAPALGAKIEAIIKEEQIQ